MDKDKLLARYTKGGGQKATGIELLKEIFEKHVTSDNLNRALAHWGFIAPDA